MYEMAATPHANSSGHLTRDVGFNHELFVLPFDHRGSFQEKMFGIKGRQPSESETLEISDCKRIIFEGFKKAVADGVPRDKAGILVDEQFGAELLKEAAREGFITACPTEKSGQDEFDFEYGDQFGEHILKFKPTFVKVLVRYNPGADSTLNRRQAARLKKLSDFCHAQRIKFMFELLVPAVPSQLEQVLGDVSCYDHELRPNLMIGAMAELQDHGVEPDIWKLEGIETPEDSKKVAAQARAKNRSQVGVIVLGRGENAEKVKHWLTTASQVEGLIGFAVGRTVFWDALKRYREKTFTREEAVAQIASIYKSFCDLWTRAHSH